MNIGLKQFQKPLFHFDDTFVSKVFTEGTLNFFFFFLLLLKSENTVNSHKNNVNNLFYYKNIA